ncbi:MAG: hypothetical protein GWO86_01015, partial [Planctomycetes bacterium]|nr:hypothetical protein [Planctomycetota bacterium]
MFVISVEITFNAEHQLTFADGSTEAMHSHNWAVTAALGRQETNENGLVFDFRILKKMLREIIAEFEDGKIGNAAYFKKNNTSAENVARY